jgi:hypothetical protein
MGIRNVALFFLVLFLTTSTLHAVVQPITQPIGRLVRTYQVTGALPFPVVTPPPSHVNVPTTPVEEVNFICGQWDYPNLIPQTVPFDVNYPVTETILTQPQHFVRLLGTPQSSSNGSWIMRSQYVRGKTPLQLRDIYALPNVPIGIVNVEMPASPDPVTGKDYALWTGPAGPIRSPGYDWGDGGATQYRLVSDFGSGVPLVKTNYFPNYRFTATDTRNHRQPIGDYALSYRPMAGCGNTYCVAAYLDSYIPEPYSDLEDVYTDLDYINYVDFGATPLRCALHQISPERYDAIPFVAFRNALLANESTLESQVYRHWADRWQHCEPGHKLRHSPTLLIQNIDEFSTRAPVACCCDNFRYNTAGALVTLDWHLRHNINFGFNGAGMHNTINWCDCGTGVCSNSGEVGAYITYAPEKFFIDVLISGGGNWAHACRSINFYQISRVAYSCPTSANVSANLQGGLTMWRSFLPYARLSYVFNRQKAFNECGADSLNFYFPVYKTHTIHADVGVELNHIFTTQQFTFMPQIQLGWGGDFFVHTHTLKAQLTGPTGCLCVSGLHQPGSYFVGCADLNLIFKGCYALLVRCEAHASTKFLAYGVKVGLQTDF